jgi:hypothetical protein
VALFACWTFGAADDAQPQALRPHKARHAYGEASPRLRVVEHVKRASVEHDVERSLDGIVREKVRAHEADSRCTAGPRASHLDRALRDVDAHHVKPLAGEPYGVRTGAAADLERTAARQDAAPDELRQMRIRFFRIPRQLAAKVMLVPVLQHRTPHVRVYRLRPLDVGYVEVIRQVPGRWRSVLPKLEHLTPHRLGKFLANPAIQVGRGSAQVARLRALQACHIPTAYAVSPVGWCSMRRSLVMILAAVGGTALFAILVYAVLMVGHVAVPGETTVNGLTARRLWATLVAMLALAGVVAGGLALTRPASRVATPRGAMLPLGLGLIGMVNGALNLAVATGGPGTGNGVVGGAAAVVLGVVAIAMGGRALARSRRTALAYRQMR